MKTISKIFSVFLALSLMLAVSYCCCIKEALAKQTHACCSKSSSEKSQPCNSKNHVCPKLVSSFGDQSIDTVKINLPIIDNLQMEQTDSEYYSANQLNQPAIKDGPPGSSSEIPLYIHFHNFRI